MSVFCTWATGSRTCTCFSSSCRAETERGLNRKHIIEGNFPLLRFVLCATPSLRSPPLISLFYPVSSLFFLPLSLCLLWFFCFYEPIVHHNSTDVFGAVFSRTVFFRLSLDKCLISGLGSFLNSWPFSSQCSASPAWLSTFSHAINIQHTLCNILAKQRKVNRKVWRKQFKPENAV